MFGQDVSRKPDSEETLEKRCHFELQLLGSIKKRFWIQWMLVSTIGAAGGTTAILLVERSILAWLFGLGVFGLLVGLAQSLVLKRIIHIRSARPLVQWILVSAASWVAGGIAGGIGAVGFSIFLMVAANVDYTWLYQHGELVFWILCVLVGATVLAKLQQRILHKTINTTRGWTSISICGWILAWGLGFCVVYITSGSELLKGVIGGAIGGVVVGISTGYALVRSPAGPK